MVSGLVVYAVGSDRFSVTSPSTSSLGAASSSRPERSVKDEDEWDMLTVDGVQYRRRKDLRTILFFGVDNAETVPGNLLSAQLNHGGRADTIAVLVLDETARTLQLIGISRDTMVPVDVYDKNDDLLYTQEMQLTLQYSLASSARRSQWLMDQKISELLYGLPIDGNFSLTMDGIAVIVDAMGGITLTMPGDYTEIDARYTEGATVTLSGAETNRFVRYRDHSVVGGNSVRMDRQTWFVKELFRQMAGMGRAKLAELLETAASYYYSDLDAETLYDIMGYTLQEEVLRVPGEATREKEMDEYYVDDPALRRLLIEQFYEPVSADPLP